MSIATLKRKTSTLYHSMSVDRPKFSLEGGYRNQGYVGQTSLGRSLPRTPMKGPTVCGNGGCCGTYYQGPIVTSAVTTTENPSVIKPSVKSADYVMNALDLESNITQNGVVPPNRIDRIVGCTLQNAVHTGQAPCPPPAWTNDNTALSALPQSTYLRLKASKCNSYRTPVLRLLPQTPLPTSF